MERENIFTGIRLCESSQSPFGKSEERKTVSLAQGNTQIFINAKNNYKRFRLDCSLPEGCSQREIYQNFVLSMVQSFINGYNCNFILCGNEQIGKSQQEKDVHDYVMLGKSTEQQKGILPRMMDQIANTIKYHKDKTFMIRVSFLEINEEDMHDLLAIKRKQMQIKYNKRAKQSYVLNLQKKDISKIDDIQAFYEMGCNKMNYAFIKGYREKRNSNSIFTIYLESVQANGTVLRQSTFTLTKLAESCFLQAPHKTQPQIIKSNNPSFNKIVTNGSFTSTQMADSHHQKLQKVNLSNNAFQNVIKSLSYSQELNSTIPYSDSKVTKLLRTAFGGDSKCCILGLINPNQVQSNSSYKIIKTLQLASQIQNYPTNLRDSQAENGQLLNTLEQIHNEQNALDKLKIELEILTNNPGQYVQMQKQKLRQNNQINQFITQEQIEELIAEQKRVKQEQLRACIKEFSKLLSAKKKIIFNLFSQDAESEPINHHQQDNRLIQQQNYTIQQRKQILIAIRDFKEKRLNSIPQQLSYEDRQTKRQVYAVEIQHEKQKNAYISTIRNLQSKLSLYQKIAEHTLKKQEIEAIRTNSRYDQTKRQYDIPSFLVNDKKARVGAAAHSVGGGRNFVSSPTSHQRRFMVSPKSTSFNRVFSDENTLRPTSSEQNNRLRKIHLARRSFNKDQTMACSKYINCYQKSDSEKNQSLSRGRFTGFSKQKKNLFSSPTSPRSPRTLHRLVRTQNNNQKIQEVMNQYCINKAAAAQTEKKKDRNQHNVFSPYKGIGTRNVQSPKAKTRFRF